jgi:glycosyltransferase involved in cell wall biosynthesis
MLSIAHRLHIAGKRYRKRELSPADFTVPSLRKRFRQICTRVKPDFILVEYIKLAFLISDIKNFLPDVVTIMDTHDIMSLRMKRFHEAGMSHWLEINEAEEAQVLSPFDIIIAIQEQEKLHLQRMLPEKKIVKAGYGHRVAHIPFPARDILSIGYLAGRGIHNIHGIQLFLNTTWQPIRTLLRPKIELHIFGTICSLLKDFQKADNGIFLHGFVDSITEIYSHVHVTVNPVVVGGGLEIKNVESLCFGRPVITTMFGAYGLENVPREFVGICNTAKEFETFLKKMLQSSEIIMKYSKNALTYAEKQFCPKSVYEELLETLKRI